MATLIDAKPPPSINVPRSTAISTVRVVDTTSYVSLPDQSIMFQPKILPDNSLTCPAYSFLISSPKGEHVLFDLGVRKDPENYPEGLVKRLRKIQFVFGAKYSVSEILDQHASTTGVAASDISAVIWSHDHFDHTGDVATFPNTTLVVGPGFLAENTPAYPENPDSGIFTKDIESHPIHEIDMADAKRGGFKIGRCDAFDYFGDGSFYLLASPGHTASHICGLARVAEDAFVLMGGDASHNMGEMRPNAYYPLPKHIQPSPVRKFTAHGCPGELVMALLPKGKANEPMYTPAPSFNRDNDEALKSIDKLVEVDAAGKCLVVLAHDPALLGQIPFFPDPIIGEEVGELDEKTRWCFLGPLGVLLEKDE